MFANPMVLWFIVGIIILLLDKAQDKITLTYASYSAFMVGVFILVNIMRIPTVGAPDYPFYSYYIVGQMVVFAVGCFVWMFVLRDAAPKAKIEGLSKEDIQKMIGKTVDVSTAGMNSVSGGEVLFRGKIFKAKFPVGTEATSLKAGAKMQIEKVTGDTLIVIPSTDE